MTTARDIMTEAPRCVKEQQTLTEAAQLMRSLDVGALPICGEDGRLHGMLTDRDIVVKAIADGKDPGSTTAGDLAQGKPVCVQADDDIQVVLQTMAEHHIRRVPVLDGHDLVGIIAQADVAVTQDPDAVGETVAVISSDGRTDDA